jgi:hypothetical protein
MSEMQDNTGHQAGQAAGSGQQPGSGQAVTGQTVTDTDTDTGQGQTGQPGMAQAGTGTGAPAGGGQPTAGQRYVPRPAPGYDDAQRYQAGAGGGRHEAAPSGAALGLTIMAAAFMMVSGLLGFFEGLAAIIRGSFFVTLPNYAFSLSAVGWGWVHLAIGAVLFIAGAALFTGHLWARIAGVIVASFAIVANFVSLPYYPVWGVVVIALNAFVIWALLTPRNPMSGEA